MFKARKVLPVLSVLATLMPFAASADPTIRTGSLVCNIAGGVGMIIMSQKAVTCRYDRVDGRQEFYTGTASKFGMDIGVTTASSMLWGVFEPAAYTGGGLGGQYTGATGQVTVGAGVGANVLVGGGNGGVTLQPLSVQVQGGLNIAGGIGALTLTEVTPPPPVTPRHHRWHGHKHWHRHHHHHHHHKAA